MTSGAGDEMRRQLEERMSELNARQEQRAQSLEKKLQELSEGLESARQLLTRDSADVGAQVQAQQQRMAELEGQLAEMTHNLNDMIEQTAKARADLDDKLGKLTSKPGEIALDASQIPPDKSAHFNAAYDAYKAADQDKARALFKEYVARYPDDTKTGDAQYWVGATYLVQNKPATALGEYRKVIALYPKSPAVDTALYGMADAFYRLHACTDAKGALDALVKRKPSKTLEERAKQLTKAIKESPKGFCTS
ncbi:MAG TPA: tetratricopeptide repeat protein [Polyangiales bacterium]|nr:tetratricopeptide repeat protein [Polyangiales bacterium]